MDFRPGKCFYWNEQGEKIYFDEWEVYGQTRQALEYLSSCRNQKSPFALFVSWHPPHNVGKFRGEDGKRHFRYDTQDELMKYYKRDSIRVRPGMESTPDLRRMYHGHMAMVTGVDIAFGWLMDKLEEIGAKENTLVIFTSDHGDMLEFAGALETKQYPHDYSLHVPFIMRWPGKISPDKSTGLLFSAMDIMPTVLGLMNQSIPRECQGKNLAKSILTCDEDAVDYVPIWSFYKNSYKGVITKNYTFSKVENTTEAPLHSVLFDRNNDPYQQKNMFKSEDQQALKDSLWQMTQEWMELYDDISYSREDLLNALSLEEWDSNRTQLPIEILQAME